MERERSGERVEFPAHSPLKPNVSITYSITFIVTAQHICERADRGQILRLSDQPNERTNFNNKANFY